MVLKTERLTDDIRSGQITRPSKKHFHFKNAKRIILILVSSILLLSVLMWIAARRFSSVECTQWTLAEEEIYTESDKVFVSMSLSFLVYGLERCENVSGTVKNILDTQKMGIIIENADITRTDRADPTTAMIDTASFIRQTVGDFRFLTDLKDTKSSFYGAAFADDENKAVWISYAGSVSFTDAVQSSLLVAGAGLSVQEKRAFEFYETVLKTEEIQNGYRLILTGHSLGGALSSMVSYMSGAESVTVSGADGLALRKIKSIAKDKPSSYQLRITNYLTMPDGYGISLKDCVQRMMFWGDYDGITCHTYRGNGLVDNSHCVFGFVQFENGDVSKPFLPE